MCRILVLLLFNVICCLAVYGQMPGVDALIDASTDIARIKVSTPPQPRKAIEGGRDNLKVSVLQPLKGPLKEGETIEIYYHLLVIDTKTWKVEPSKFVEGQEYIVFLHANCEIKAGSQTPIITDYELTDQWLSVQPVHPMLLQEILTRVHSDERLNLQDPRLSEEERALLKQIPVEHLDEIVDVSAVKADQPQVQRNNELILSVLQKYRDHHTVMSIDNHSMGEEGATGWQYLFDDANGVWYVIDPREDNAAVDKKVRKYRISNLRVVYRNPAKENTLVQFDGRDATEKVLILQLQLADQGEYTTFQ